MAISFVTLLADYQQAIWSSAFGYFNGLFGRNGIINWLFRNDVEFLIPFCVAIGAFIVFTVFKLVSSGGRHY